MDISALTEISVQYGIFAGLFIVLLVYVIKNNDKREKLYHDMLNNINTKILDKANENNGCLGQLSKDVDVIDTKVHSIENKVDDIDRKVDAVSIKVDGLANRI